ncbi:hypothetical protein M407DRAFT_24012 [Tulasnella calospora MUT 4182]|uniref:Uncharacterized protein n=1 Tax=Tulasnella calospora MUT 4182 TaxID=1051891 RepID=A0A0C3QK54_9AGAM|nr:hypothetical protein M407DRAFT_24012 [Tulasnella calospora MUT 4182]
MERVFDLLGFKRSSRQSHHQQQSAFPSPQALPEAWPRERLDRTLVNVIKNALGLSVADPSSLPIMSSPQRAYTTTPTSSLLWTRQWKSRIRFMEQN